MCCSIFAAENVLGDTLYIVMAWSVPVEYDCKSILSLCSFPLHNSLDNDTCYHLAFGRYFSGIPAFDAILSFGEKLQQEL